MTTRQASRSLVGNMRRAMLLDLLMLLGLILIGMSVYLWLGLPALLAYAGGMLVVLAVALSQTEMGAKL